MLKKYQERTGVDIESISSEQNFTQTILHLEDPGTLKSSFVIVQGVPFANPSDTSILTQTSAGKPSPRHKYLFNPFVFVASSGIFIRIFSCKEDGNEVSRYTINGLYNGFFGIAHMLKNSLVIVLNITSVCR